MFCPKKWAINGSAEMIVTGRCSLVDSITTYIDSFSFSLLFATSPSRLLLVLVAPTKDSPNQFNQITLNYAKNDIGILSSALLPGDNTYVLKY